MTSRISLFHMARKNYEGSCCSKTILISADNNRFRNRTRKNAMLTIEKMTALGRVGLDIQQKLVGALIKGVARMKET